MKPLRFGLIKRYLRPHWKTLSIGALCIVIVNLLGVSIPLQLKEIIDSLKDDFTMTDLLKKTGWIVILATTMGFVRLISRQLVFGVGRQVEVNLRQRLFDHILVQDPGWLQEIGSGEVISRATSDVENIRRLMGFAILNLTDTLLAYSLTIPAMISISPFLTFSSLSLYPLVLGTVGLFGGRMVRQRRLQQEALSSLSELIQEDLSGISAIKIYGQEGYEKKAFSNLNDKYKESAINLARTASTLFPLLQGISSISLLLLIFFGSKFLGESLTVGGLVGLIFFVNRLVFPTALLGFTLNTFQTGQVSIERVEELLSKKPNVRNTANSIPLREKIKGKLEAKELTIRYEKSNKDTLQKLSFSIEPGELVAIVGPVGCGKTTLARAIGRMVNVPKGQLFLDNYDVIDLTLEDLRKNIALVPQEGYLFTNTLSENLRFGDPLASLKQIEDSAKQARLMDDIKGFPDGLNTLVGERGITLSGGQRQRTALGRALLISSPVLVLDDALASVDNKTASAILSSIRSQTDRTILLISHQLSAAACCDRILVLNEGQLIQEGKHNDLIKTDGMYKRLWEREQAAEQLGNMR